MYSRRLKVEEKENKRKAIGFTFLTLAFIAFMIYFGLPLLAQISNFTYDLKKSNEPVERSDKTPPPPPKFNDLPSFTNKEKLDIRGTTEPGVTVFISLGLDEEQVISDNSGNFNATINLKDGVNEIKSYTKDSADNKSQETIVNIIVLDKKSPDLEVTKPKSGDQFVGSKQKQISIDGQTEKDAEVQINDRHVVVGATGAFNYIYGLNEGENILTIKSQDLAGNITELTITVNFTP